MPKLYVPTLLPDAVKENGVPGVDGVRGPPPLQLKDVANNGLSVDLSQLRLTELAYPLNGIRSPLNDAAGVLDSTVVAIPFVIEMT